MVKKKEKDALIVVPIVYFSRTVYQFCYIGFNRLIIANKSELSSLTKTIEQNKSRSDTF